MATKPKDPDNPQQGPVARSFKAETGKFDSLKVNESITGLFMGARDQQITDVRTRQPKTIFVIKLRDESADKVRKIPCAAMLLQTWEELVDEYGNGDQDAAMKFLHGRKITINRGSDTKTRDNNVMGTYEIIVWD